MKIASILAGLAAVSVMSATRPVLPEPERQPGRLQPPDRLSVDVDSPYYDECYKRVGVRLNGVERRQDVQEYCVSEGWIDVRSRRRDGRFLRARDGRYVTTRLHGDVIAYFKDDRPTRRIAPAYRSSAESNRGTLAKAAEKRARKAAKLARDFGAR